MVAVPSCFLLAVDNLAGVSVLLGNSDGTFQPAQSYSAGAGSRRSVAVGDLNADGILDLVVIGSSVHVLLGNGDGTFQTTNVGYIAGTGSIAAVVADLTGDNWPDLVVANSRSNDVAVLLNGTDWGSPPPGLGRRPSAPSRAAKHRTRIALPPALAGRDSRLGEALRSDHRPVAPDPGSANVTRAPAPQEIASPKRFTPTHVGKTLRLMPVRGPTTVHPHARGEDPQASII